MLTRDPNHLRGSPSRTDIHTSSTSLGLASEIVESTQLLFAFCLISDKLYPIDEDQQLHWAQDRARTKAIRRLPRHLSCDRGFPSPS